RSRAHCALGEGNRQLGEEITATTSVHPRRRRKRRGSVARRADCLPACRAPGRELVGKGGRESNRNRVSKSALRFFVCDGARRESSGGQTGDSMVRTVIAACFVLLLAIPALAQEDYPKIQTAMGYANLGFVDFGTGNSSRHSGFANQTGFNLTKTWGLENYMGIYGLGSGVTLISDFFGGKATYRAAKVAPYALAGIGVGYFTQSSSYGYG